MPRIRQQQADILQNDSLSGNKTGIQSKEHGISYNF
jgi:hypothetical protein